jgi:hypothetical protein
VRSKANQIRLVLILAPADPNGSNTTPRHSPFAAAGKRRKIFEAWQVKGEKMMKSAI